MADACGAGWQPQRVLRSLLIPNELLPCVHADLLWRHEGRPQWRCARRASSAACASAGARDAAPACSSAASRACRSRRREQPRLDRGRSQPDRAPVAHSTAAVWVLAPADPPSDSDGCAESRTKPHAERLSLIRTPENIRIARSAMFSYQEARASVVELGGLATGTSWLSVACEQIASKFVNESHADDDRTRSPGRGRRPSW